MDLLIVSFGRQFGICNLYFEGLHRCSWEIDFLGTWYFAENVQHGLDWMDGKSNSCILHLCTWSLLPVKNDSLKFVTTRRPSIPSSRSRRLLINVVYRTTFLALATSNSPEIIHVIHKLKQWYLISCTNAKLQQGGKCCRYHSGSNAHVTFQHDCILDVPLDFNWYIKKREYGNVRLIHTKMNTNNIKKFHGRLDD